MPDGASLRGDLLPASSAAGSSWVYLPGLASVRHGNKSAALMKWADNRGDQCLLLDHRGHGDSEGRMEQLTLSQLVHDTRNALQWLRDKNRAGDRPVLVGSSAGWSRVGLQPRYRDSRFDPLTIVVQWPELVGNVVMLAPAFGLPGR